MDVAALPYLVPLNGEEFSARVRDRRVIFVEPIAAVHEDATHEGVIDNG